MSNKKTWNIYLIHRATGQERYLGYVYEETELEAQAAADTLYSPDPDECTLEVRELR